uniref:DALR domain-containing protein n=1 Tax=Pontibacter rugosus TaxID=1745966 RepID=UPI0036718280
HEGSLTEAEAAYDRIAGFLERAEPRLEGVHLTDAPSVPEAFAVAMDDDLSVPQALAVLHETVRTGNAALDADDAETLGTAYHQVAAMVEVLGIDPRAAHWSGGGHDTSAGPLAALVERLVQERADARAARDFTAADRVRDDLAAAGITIEDTPSGTRWSIA